MSFVHIILFIFFLPGKTITAPGIIGADRFGYPMVLRDNLISQLPQIDTVEALPLKVLNAPADSTLPIFIFISGDGGWNTFNESLCGYLSKKGVPVVALNSQKYFWGGKTPDEATADLVAVIKHYQQAWKRTKFVLAGYSFGADIVPFVMNRLSPDVKGQLVSSIMISPDKTGDFEIHLSDMLNLGLSKGKYDVINEVLKRDNRKIVVFFGSDESQNTQQAFQQTGVQIVQIEGNHHFDSSYEALADKILTEIK